MNDFKKYLQRKWNNGYRFILFKGKPSTKNLIKLCEENKTTEYTLVVHSEDVEYKEYFPNNYTITKRKEIEADLHCDIFYDDLVKINENSFACILCTGLLEHIPEPKKLIDNLYRILKPNGKLIISASSAFSLHEGPNDYFHFTHYSFLELFKNWSKVGYIKASCGPFETIGILLHRILLQCDIYLPIRLIVELISKVIPLFDIFIKRQYDCVGYKNKERLIDSMLPSNIQAVFYK